MTKAMRVMAIYPAAIFMAACTLSASAQESAPPASLTFSGTAALVSDYRFRGVSQTDKRVAVQGGITASHISGLYTSVWASSIADYVATGADQEIDFAAGYTRVMGAATIDAGIVYYSYPGSGGANTDFFETYANIQGTLGPVTAKTGLSYAPRQHAIALAHNRDDNAYIYGELSSGIPNSPFSLTAHVGESFGQSFMTGNARNYTDWSVNASCIRNNLTFGITYVDTDLKASDGFVNKGRKTASAGVYGTVALTF